MKTISTFIAVVLLVVFTVSIGLLIYLYFKGFILQQTKGAERIAKPCEALFSLSTELNLTHLKIFYGISSGSDKVYNLSASIVCADKFKVEKLTEQLSPGEYNFTIVDVSNMNCDYDNIKININGICNDVTQVLFSCEKRACK